MNKYQKKYGEDIWKLIVAARKIVLQFNSPVFQQYMTRKQLMAYEEITKITYKIAPMLKGDL